MEFSTGKETAGAKLLLPDRVAEQLRCDLCRGYLSVPPIASQGDRVSCGRCSAPGWPRNLPYERLARLTLFPCTYCRKRVTWDEAASHEERCGAAVALCPPASAPGWGATAGEYHRECQWRAVTCPFDYCDARCQVGEVAPHFEKFHKGYIFPDGLVTARKILKEEKVWNFTCDNQVCLLLHRRTPFLLFIHGDCDYDESTGDITAYGYQFGVFSFCKRPCHVRYTAKLTLECEGASSEHVLRNQDVKTFNEKLHLINFIRIGLIKQNSFNFLTTKFDNLKRCDDLILTYSVQLQDTQDALPVPRDHALNAGGALIKHLECPICKEYMYAPIYNCDLGHSVCKTCKSKLTTCPFCKAFIGNSRNFALEDILENLQVACQNERKGCRFSGVVPEVRFHELTCVYNSSA